jgi:hypothetical protein
VPRLAGTAALPWTGAVTEEVPPLVPRRPPVPARVYAYLAGDGYHHDEADEALGDQLAGIYPGVRRLVASNRAYPADAARLACSDLKFRQFLDLGSGFPGPGSVRETVQAADPAATVACVDQDPAVRRHGSRLATRASRTS